MDESDMDDRYSDGWSDGHRDGYDEGYEAGWREAQYEIEQLELRIAELEHDEAL